MISIELAPWEYEHGCNVGIRRFTANWNKENAKHYDQSRMEDDRTAQAAAALCELAVAKHTNNYWGGHVWAGSDHHKYRDIPDVGSNIEVRRVRTRNAVAVRKSQLGKGLSLWAARAVEPEFRTIVLLGHINYDIGWNISEPSTFSESTRYVPVERLMPV